MKPLYFMLVFLGLLTLGACNGTRPTSGWWRYGFSGSSPFWEELHQYDQDPTTNGRLLVAITVFSDETHAIHYTLDRDGLGMTERDGKKGVFKRPFAELQKAKAEVTKLTPGGPYPAISSLVIIRWHGPNAWETAHFDRNDLPLHVQNLALAVTGHGIGDIAP